MKKTFSSTTLKYIAIIAMTIDHTALLMVSSDNFIYYFMRLIGRLTAPIMAFFISEGFQHSKNLRKYFFRLLFFGFISQPFYYYMICKNCSFSVFAFCTNLNVMFTLSLSLLILICLNNNKIPLYLKIILISMCFVTADICDWSYILPTWALIFYFFRKNSKLKFILYIAASLTLLLIRYYPYYESFISFSFNFGVLLALVPLELYNGKRQKSNNNFSKKLNRWIFYFYYPLHILILIIIDFLFIK